MPPGGGLANAEREDVALAARSGIAGAAGASLNLKPKVGRLPVFRTDDRGHVVDRIGVPCFDDQERGTRERDRPVECRID